MFHRPGRPPEPAMWSGDRRPLQVNRELPTSKQTSPTRIMASHWQPLCPKTHSGTRRQARTVDRHHTAFGGGLAMTTQSTNAESVDTTKGQLTERPFSALPPSHA